MKNSKTHKITQLLTIASFTGRLVRRRAMLPGLILLSTLLLPLSNVLADEEALVSYVNKFGSGSRCCSGCSQLSWGDDDANHLASKLNSWGYDRLSQPNNTGVEFHEWADYTRVGSDGDDNSSPYGVDSTDIAFIDTHGTRSCSGDWGLVVLGDGYEECNLNYGRTSNDVQWGDADLNGIILDACQTVHKCVWSGGGFGSVYVRSGNMTIVNGFHGIAYEGYWHNWHFENYVDDTRHDNFGDEWVDEMTDLIIGSNNDECATSVIWASSKSNANGIYNNMGFQDWKSVTTGSIYFYSWGGCNPDEGEEL